MALQHPNPHRPLHDLTHSRGTPRARAGIRTHHRSSTPGEHEALQALLWSACEGWGLSSASWIPVTRAPESDGVHALDGDPGTTPRGGYRLVSGCDPGGGSATRATSPEGRNAITSGRPLRPREIDWSPLLELRPGACLGAARKRSPRVLASDLDQLWAAPTRGQTPGVLLLIGAGGRLPSPDRALELAERLATLARKVSPRESARAREAGWAHDLRNRLTHALLGLERLRIEQGENAEGSSLDAVARSLQLACAACADRLQDPSRSNASEGTVVPPVGRTSRALSLRGLLQRATRSAAEIADPSGRGQVKLLLRCPSRLVTRAEGSLVHRVAENLTLNALQASAPGPPGAEVRIGASLENGHLCLTVADRGRGMNARELELFRTPGRTGRRAAGGTGYGSASLFDCLERLGADLDLETEPGKGTRVRVRWREPLAGRPPEDALEAPALTWNPWDPAASLADLDAALASREGAGGGGVPNSAAGAWVPRGAFGPHLAAFAERCAGAGWQVLPRSCRSAEGQACSAPPRSPQPATWGTRGARTVSRST